MIEREITQRLTTLFQQYPFVTVTGPRQSGKTTLCRSAFPELDYANLEAPDQRDFAESDPRGFLAQFDDGAIIDEVQHVPALMSYLQVIADERGQNGLFVLTGSEQFRLSDAINQSLAGRTALLRLLPLSLTERQWAGVGGSVDDILYSGFYPRIIDQGLNPTQALGDYFETYVERDVRRMGEIRNLSNFRRFVRLCAGRIGQLVNLSSLGADAGVSHTTAREWLTVLEASYIIFQLPPYFANISKRLIKSPKFYFCDVGLAAYLIGIENAGQVVTHPLRGALFENAVVAEALKHRFNRGNQANLSFFRDSKGLECDLLYPAGSGFAAFEVKSGATIGSDYFRSLHRMAQVVPDITSKTVVYGGETRQSRSDSEVIPLSDLGDVLDMLEVDRGLVAFKETSNMDFYTQKAGDIDAALVDLGIDKSQLERESIRHLPSIMYDDELPEVASVGSYDGNTGILVATSRRLLFIRDSLPETPFARWSTMEHPEGLPPGHYYRRVLEVGFGQNKIVEGRDTIDSVRSRTALEDGELIVTYHSWELREWGTTEYAIMDIRGLTGDNPKLFADFLQEKSGLLETETQQP